VWIRTRVWFNGLWELTDVCWLGFLEVDCGVADWGLFGFVLCLWLLRFVDYGNFLLLGNVLMAVCMFVFALLFSWWCLGFDKWVRFCELLWQEVDVWMFLWDAFVKVLVLDLVLWFSVYDKLFLLEWCLVLNCPCCCLAIDGLWQLTMVWW